MIEAWGQRMTAWSWMSVAMLLAVMLAVGVTPVAAEEADEPAEVEAEAQAEADADGEAEVDAEADGEVEADAEADAPVVEIDEEADALVVDGEALAIVVEAVEGMVQVRAAPEADFERAEAGMELGIGAAFRTGPRSLVRFRVGDSQRITLDRLGTVEVLEAIQREGVITTDIGMPYGRTRYEIQAVEDVEHSGRIRSPAATLAVDGSEGFLEDYADRPPTAGSDSGDISFVNTRGRFVKLDPPARIQGDQTAGGDYEVVQATYNRLGLSMTEDEFELLGLYPSGTFEHWLADVEAFHAHDGARAGFMHFAETTDGRGGEGGGNGQFIDVGSEGDMRGQLVWNTPADLDLHLILPDGQRVWYAEPSVTFFDDQGQATASLDVDIIPTAEDPTPHVENIFVSILEGQLPAGDYQFFVNSFTSSSDGIDSGTLSVDSTGDGMIDRQLSFQLEEGQDSERITVTVPSIFQQSLARDTLR